jgi:hypothetical protein
MSAGNHSEFIRNHPKLSVADLILEASKQGLSIKKNLIYNVRSKSRNATDEDTPVVKKKVSKKAKVAAVKAKAVSKKVSKKAKVAAVKITHRRAARTQEAPAALVAQNGTVTRQPVAIVFFDSDALIKGMKAGFPQPVL